MKKALLAIIMIVGVLGLFAQGTLDKGKLQVNAGLGVSSWGVPIYVGADYGVYDLTNNLGNITAGGELSYRSWGNSGWRYTIIGLSVNGNWHFTKMLNLPENVDTYVGLSLGYTGWIYPSGYPSWASHYASIGFAGQAGARYFFSDKLGAQIEFGGGTVSGMKVGVTYKL